MYTGFWENLYTYKSPCMYTGKVYIRGVTYKIIKNKIPKPLKTGKNSIPL